MCEEKKVSIKKMDRKLSKKERVRVKVGEKVRLRDRER